QADDRGGADDRDHVGHRPAGPLREEVPVHAHPARGHHQVDDELGEVAPLADRHQHHQPGRHHPEPHGAQRPDALRVVAEQQLGGEGRRDHAQGGERQHPQHPAAGEAQRHRRVRIRHGRALQGAAAQGAADPVALDADAAVGAAPHRSTSASSSSEVRAAATVTSTPAPASSRAYSCTWAVSTNGEVKPMVSCPAWEIAQNWGRTAETWNCSLPTWSWAGAGSVTRPRLEIATGSERVCAWLIRLSSRSLTGRGTIRASGQRSTRISRWSLRSSASGVASALNASWSPRATAPRESSPRPKVCSTRMVAKKFRAEVGGKNCRRFTGT